MAYIRGGISLSKEQADIVDHVASEHVTTVSAGAGSGKTRTMVAAVLDLVENKPNVNVDDFILITFTNKATDEMRERLQVYIQTRISGAEDNNLTEEQSFWFNQKERLASSFIGTIHGFCSMILHQFGYDELIPHETDVLTARRFFLQALDQTMEDGITDPATSILFNYDEVPWMPHKMRDYLEDLYHHIRGKGRTIQKVVHETECQTQDVEFKYRLAVAKMLNKLENFYIINKEQAGGVDTNDLLHKTAELLKKHSAHIGRLLGERFQFIFVDEFQDTDRLQKTIIQSLLPYMERILVVGDRKQAIYGFRGADDSILQEIATESGQPLMLLKASRRPTKPLFEAQTVLFSEMSQRYEVLEELLTLPPEGAHEPKDELVPFEYIQVVGDDKELRIDEAIRKVRTYLSQEIDSINGRRPIEPGDICLLFRVNTHMDRYYTRFKQAGIKVTMDVGGQFFKTKEILHCFYMLQAIIKYPDDVSLDLVLGTAFFPLKAPVSLLKHDYRSNPFCDWLEDEPTAKRWYETMMLIRTRSKIDLVPHLLTKLFELTGVRELYAKEGNIQAVANLEKLITWSRDQMNVEALTLQQFFSRLQTAILSKEEVDEAEIGDADRKKDAIIFSSIHSAKGLEYPVVIIPELQRPLLNKYNRPSFFDRADYGLDLELPGSHGPSPRFQEWISEYEHYLFGEEARVFYVAVTRAQHVVCLISGGQQRINRLGSEYWSWKDEVLSARTTLQIKGPDIVRFTPA